MPRQISLTDFRERISGCNRFIVSTGCALSPANLSAAFDRAHVCVSASPYIGFTSDTAKITLSHIKSIVLHRRKNGTATYAIMCLDYNGNFEEPSATQFKVECINHQKGD